MRKQRSDKITFTIKDITKVESMSAMGLSLEQIASILGVSTDTIYRRMNEGNIDLSAALSRGKSKALFQIANKAYKLALEGNPSMIKYFLSCRGGWSEKLQIIDDTRAQEEQEKNRELDAIVSAMTKEDIKQYEQLNEQMNEIVERVKIKL
jgi:predicted transcriptional regulator